MCCFLLPSYQVLFTLVRALQDSEHCHVWLTVLDLRKFNQHIQRTRKVHCDSPFQNEVILAKVMPLRQNWQNMYFQVTIPHTALQTWTTELYASNCAVQNAEDNRKALEQVSVSWVLGIKIQNCWTCSMMTYPLLNLSIILCGFPQYSHSVVHWICASSDTILNDVTIVMMTNPAGRHTLSFLFSLMNSSMITVNNF